MKLWLDDVRPAPNHTWIWAQSYENALFCLKTKSVTIMSVDHNLGEHERTGYDVMVWLERHINTILRIPVPEIMLCHGGTALERKRIEDVIDQINERKLA